MSKKTEQTVAQMEQEVARINTLIAEATKKGLKEGDEVIEVSVKKDGKKDKKDSKKDKDDGDKDDDKDDVKESVKKKFAARLESYAMGEQPAVVSGVDPLTGKTRTTSKDTVLPGHEGHEDKVVNGGDNGAPAQSISPKLTQEDVAAIFQGADLSEEVKSRAVVVFEAAVNAKVKSIKEAAIQSLEEAVEEIEEGLLEKVDEFLAYFTTEWAEENKLAIDSSLQLEIYEDFFAAMRAVYLEHNITIPEGKEDVLETKSKEVIELTKKLNEATEKLMKQDKSILESKKEKVIAELCEGLVATSAEKLKTLVEDIEAKDETSFRAKALIVKESYFKDSTTKTPAKPADGTKIINESVDGDVARLFQSLKQINKPQ